MSNNIIDKDKEWFKERIERGIEGFIDCEREYLTTLLMKCVYEDIFLSCCSINSRDVATSEAILQIRTSSISSSVLPLFSKSPSTSSRRFVK